jgi:hypothetical protein
MECKQENWDVGMSENKLSQSLMDDHFSPTTMAIFGQNVCPLF